MIWILLASLAAAAPAPGYTSTYTPLNLDACRVLGRAAQGEGDWIDLRCPGLRGIPLLLHGDDGRFDVDAGVDNNDWEALGGLHTLGPQVEWRLRRGRPIAIIFRYIQAGPGQPPGTRLAVKSIGRAGRPGCLISMIDGALPNANAVARERADRRAEGFRCGTDTPERGAE
jgi:hypothetical protein